MASFITTMLVPESPSLAAHVSPPKPLEPIFTPGEPSPCIQRPSSSSIRSLYEAASWTSSSSTIKEMDSLGQKRSTSPVKKFLNKVIYGNKQPPSSSQIFEPQKNNNATHDTSLLRRSNTVDDFLSSNSRTRAGAPFKPKNASRGTTSWQLKQFAEATLGSGSLRKAVKLPEGEDENEWLAVNVVDFYNQINLLYGSITEFCSPQSCPEMKATDEFEYLWQDNENFKKPTKMPAPEYIEHLMAWVQSNVDNEQMFPSRIGVPFPKTFKPLLLQIFKRLYRVYAHIYCHHYPVIINLGLEPHLNTSFKHYVLFVDEHNLAMGRDFWGPLGDLVDSMLKSD